MKILAAAFAVLVLSAATAHAGDEAISKSTLNSMGLGGMQSMSDSDGLAVRGKGLDFSFLGSFSGFSLSGLGGTGGTGGGSGGGGFGGGGFGGNFGGMTGTFGDPGSLLQMFAAPAFAAANEQLPAGSQISFPLF